LFTGLLQAGLRPRAQKKKHPQAFWRGWRFLALDGTTFSVGNTPQLTGGLHENGEPAAPGGVRQIERSVAANHVSVVASTCLTES
jgi:hypothetical protein